MILIAGNNIRHVVSSARRSGYRVCSCDSYQDSDLLLYSDRAESIEKFDALVKEFDAIVLGCGFEGADVPEDRVLGTPPGKIKRLLDKKKQWKILDKYGFIQPELVDNLEENEWGVVKPRYGSGGTENRLVKGHADYDKKREILQRYVDGTPCSVCVISTGEGSVAIAVNRQLLGVEWAGQNRPFTYCGNITPFPSRDVEKIAEDVVESLDLIGCNGVDFVIGDRPYVIEVNPRFQGSLDSIELSTDVNLFRLHVDACRGKLPEKPSPKRYAGRIILFSRTDIRTPVDLTGNPFLADIPPVNRRIGAGSPILSVLATGQSEIDVTGKLKRISEWVYGLFEGKPNI